MADNSEECRQPNEGDLISVCRALNAEGVDCLVIGGYAVIQHGYQRTTQDIDLLLR